MIEIDSVAQLPQVPAVYAMHSGRNRNLHVAYVGIAGKLKDRITQHLIRRDSSVTTGTSAASLLPQYVTEVWWWSHPDFEDRANLEAAEVVAFEVLQPALRSRGVLSDNARKVCNDPNFTAKMTDLFNASPTGQLILPTLEIAIERIRTLENRLAELEAALKLLTQKPL